MVVYYRKIPKIVQRPLLRALYLEVVIFGGAYLRREICVSKSIELALQLEVNLPFLLRFTLYLRASFQVQAPGAGGGGYFTKGFLRYWSGGAYIWRGLFLEFYGILIKTGSCPTCCTHLQSCSIALFYVQPCLIKCLCFQALHAGYTVDQIHELTSIDRWFLHKLQRIVDIESDLKNLKL